MSMSRCDDNDKLSRNHIITCNRLELIFSPHFSKTQRLCCEKGNKSDIRLVRLVRACNKIEKYPLQRCSVSVSFSNSRNVDKVIYNENTERMIHRTLCNATWCICCFVTIFPCVDRDVCLWLKLNGKTKNCKEHLLINKHFSLCRIENGKQRPLRMNINVNWFRFHLSIAH